MEHQGTFGHCYIYYRHEDDDDDEICRECAMKIFRENGLLGNCNSQYRAHEGDGRGKCDRCKKNMVKSYWTCCFSLDPLSITCQKTN